MDWESIFVPDVHLFEMILRGSLMYISLFVLLRVILKRQTGSIGMTDLLLITLIADASQNAMAGEYKSIPDGIVLVSTIIFWSYTFDWLSYKFPVLNRIIEPGPLPLIEDGKLIRRNMQRELISKNELMTLLREQGLEDLGKVKKAYIESDGHISIIQQEQKQQKMVDRKKN